MELIIIVGRNIGEKNNVANSTPEMVNEKMRLFSRPHARSVCFYIFFRNYLSKQYDSFVSFIAKRNNGSHVPFCCLGP